MARTGAPVMGTILQVTVIADDDAAARRLADASIAEARRWDDILTTWRSDGELARLNARAGTGLVPVSADLFAALQQMQKLSVATGGAFDPVAGALSLHWRDESVPKPAPQPTLHRIAAALTLRDGKAALAKGTALDAGGIGKGIALDRIAGLLRAGGAQAAFADFGGSSQIAVGAPPGSAQGWNVLVTGLRTGQVAGLLLLRDRALSTSRAIGTGAAGPIIDPESAMPVAPPRLATVQASDAATAEAWSKAAVIRGRAGLQAARAARIEVRFEDGDGYFATPAFEALAPPSPQNSVETAPNVLEHEIQLPHSAGTGRGKR